MFKLYRFMLPFLAVSCWIPRESNSFPTSEELNPKESIPVNNNDEINIKKSTDQDLNSNLPRDAADVVGILIDVVYSLNQTLLYGASFLRIIKWFLFILKFIG
ncbi:uncharacterized protein LOC132087763 [Daphnia carinata]|uniref:uncharacterized protein LOC132087763 n=1 Tax=Daphnia carinata TaxID=120202 RepID=UPI0028686EB3|nr:uncharacterized protein LOC132087763 [Daphnia carinata]